MAEKTDEGSGASSPKRRSNNLNGSPSFADFSYFREMIREERDTAQAQGDAAQVWLRELRDKQRPPSSDGLWKKFSKGPPSIA